MQNLNENNAMYTTTCPACGMLCDDVSPTKTSCEKSIAFFSQANKATDPRSFGRTVSLDQAVIKIADLIKLAKQPLIGGLGTDLTGFRAAYELANKCNATLAHMNAAATWRNTKVLQSVGWQTTTMTEVRNRADVIVFIGTDVIKHNPRFFERVIWPKETMFVENENRDITYLGAENLDTSHGVSPKGNKPTVLPCNQEQLPQVTAALHALVANKKLNVSSVAGIALADLENLANRLKQAKYATLIWVAKDLDFPHAELTIQQITQTVVDLNKTTRAGALAMGGSDGDTTVNYAHTWLSGLAIHQEVLPEHDVLVWVNSFSPDKELPSTKAPTIVIGNSNMHFESEPDVYIPIATPGLDCNGTMIRVDSNVILPFKKVKESSLPTLTEVLQQVEAAVLKASSQEAP
ncbi:MAG TPA: formylmethanofuran dehydrogenase [Methylophilaceae bacterium]|nr:formylmethanofuran dehydrogenase [Methylophilaceae bacterium]